jgi:hypothetical protein
MFQATNIEESSKLESKSSGSNKMINSNSCCTSTCFSTNLNEYSNDENYDEEDHDSIGINQLNSNVNFLAVDCNLESYSSLSSSSSSSSCSSTTETASIVASSSSQNLQVSNNGVMHLKNMAKLLLKDKLVNKNINTIKRNSFNLSNECLSSDEGYVGSYSDNIAKNNAKNSSSNNPYLSIDQTSSRTSATQERLIKLIDLLLKNLETYLSPQDKKNLFKYILESNIDFSDHDGLGHIDNSINFVDLSNKSASTGSSIQPNEEINDDENSAFSLFDYMEKSIYCNESNTQIDVEIPCLFENQMKEQYSDINLLNETDSYSYLDNYDCFDIVNRLMLSRFYLDMASENFNQDEEEVFLLKNFCSCCFLCSVDDSSLNENDGVLSNIWTRDMTLGCHKNECLFKVNDYEIKQIVDETNERKCAEAQVDEREMKSSNWRAQLNKRTWIEGLKRESEHEDFVDLEAYLNEIEMNLDHLQHDSIYMSQTNEVVASETSNIDTWLKFSSNQMAFNLRKHYEYLTTRFNHEQKLKKISNKNIKDMFKNFEKIPEFRPVVNNNENALYYDNDMVTCSNDYETGDMIDYEFDENNGNVYFF